MSEQWDSAGGVRTTVAPCTTVPGPGGEGGLICVRNQHGGNRRENKPSPPQEEVRELEQEETEAWRDGYRGLPRRTPPPGSGDSEPVISASCQEPGARRGGLGFTCGSSAGLGCAQELKSNLKP